MGQMMDSKTLWIAGRVEEFGPTWAYGMSELIGVYYTEEKAVAACTKPLDFVGPSVLNVTHPEICVSWPGAYYPAEKELA